MSCQSFGRISATLVFQVRFDKPAGGGVVLRPYAKSSITIPREADRNAFEQEARLNSVYKAYPSRHPISTFEGQQNKSAHVCSHVCAILGFDTHAPNSAGPVLLTMAKVNPGTPSESTISCIACTTSGVRIVADVSLTFDLRSLPAVPSTAL